MTPSKLAAELVEIVAEECDINVMWSQHATPLSINEAARVAARIERYMKEVCTQTSFLQISNIKGGLNA